MSDNDYVCSLDDASSKKAKAELHEDEKERLGAVQTFREWVVQQPHIACPTDTLYLLRFLRPAKFSQLVARQKLGGFLGCKTEFPKWYNDIDTTDPAIQAVLDSGYMVPLPGKDSEGRKIILGKEGALDTHSKIYNVDTVMRAVFATMFHLLCDENTQVNGFIYFADMSNFSIKHQTFWGIDGMKNSTRCFEGNMPARFKGFWVYNPGAIFDAMMTIVKPFMSQKTLDRMVLFGENMEKVYKKIPKHMLPNEYLPDEYDGPSAGSHRSLIEKFKQEMAAEKVRQRVLYETKAEYGIDKKAAPTDVPQASFRKLNVD